MSRAEFYPELNPASGLYAERRAMRERIIMTVGMSLSNTYLMTI